MKFQEGKFLIDFAGAPSVERLDEPGRRMPIGMKLVDFVVEEAGRILLIEVKDPLPEEVPPEHRGDVEVREMDKFLGDALIRDALVPKARDTYCFFHLMERDSKPFDFIFLTGLDRLGVTSDQLIHFQDRLSARLRNETDEPWGRQYVRNCVVLTMSDWNKHMTPYAVQRL